MYNHIKICANERWDYLTNPIHFLRVSDKTAQGTKLPT